MVYEGTTLPVVGIVLLYVCYHCLLYYKLVDHTDIHPLLGQMTCPGMKIVSYLDTMN